MSAILVLQTLIWFTNSNGDNPLLTIDQDVIIPANVAIQVTLSATGVVPQLTITATTGNSLLQIGADLSTIRVNFFATSGNTIALSTALTAGIIITGPGTTQTFTTNNHDISVGQFSIAGATNVNLGSSTVHLIQTILGNTPTTSTGILGVAGTGIFNAGTSVISVENSIVVSTTNSISISANQTFYDILIGANIRAEFNIAISGVTFTMNNLAVNPGSRIDFARQSGTNFFKINGFFTSTATSGNHARIETAPHDNVVWNLNSPTNAVFVDYVDVGHSTASGVIPFKTAGGVDNGNNTNWTFLSFATQNKTITGVANIQKTTLRAISAKARVTAKTIRTISGISRIQKTNSPTITGKANILPVSPWFPDPTPFFYSGPLLTTAMYSYFIEVRDQFGHLVTILDRPMNKEFTLYRNKSGSCRFELDLFDPQADPSILQKGIYDIVIRRRGIPVFAGQITYAEPTIDNTDKGTVTVMATGYLDLFLNRMVTLSYPFYDPLQNQLIFGATDSAAVIATMIDYAQFPINTDASITMQNTTTYNQSFVAPGSANVLTLKLLLRQIFSPSGNIVIGLYADSGGFPGTLVPNSQVTVPVSSLDASQFFQYEVDYSPTYPVLVKGTTYWVQAHLDTVQSGSNGVAWGYLNGDYLPTGKAYSSGFAFSADQDLKFWIYLDDNSFEQTEYTYLGILEGGLPSSFNIQPVFSEFKKVQNIIDETTKLNNGVDFDIEVQIDGNNVMRKYYNIFYPQQGSDKTNLLFSWPGGNIIKLGKKQDSTTIVNKQYTRGQGTGIYQQVAISIVQSSVRQYGLREGNDDFSDIPDLATLQSIGDENVRVRSVPLDVPQFTVDGNKPGAPNITQFTIGDTIRITARGSGFLDFQTDYRIEQMHVTISDNGEEYVEITNSLA